MEEPTVVIPTGKTYDKKTLHKGRPCGSIVPRPTVLEPKGGEDLPEQRPG
jgi:hypothetical protein